MRRRPVIFLDDGGVMNDNRVRASQWPHLVGEFLAPILGGLPAAWAEANRVLADRLFEPAAWNARVAAATGYADLDWTYQLDWLRGMCELVGIAPPRGEECYDLAVQAAANITCRVRAAFPGAIDAIRTLHSGGYLLHTASGEASRDLEGYLAGMNVRHCFDRLYGPDLVDTLKAGPDYYARLFADAGVTPADALVLDDSPIALGWAAGTGARTLLVVDAAPGILPHPARIPGLAYLPAIIDSFG